MMLLREFLNRDIDAEQAQEIPSFVPLYASNISILDDGPTITRARPGYINPLRLNPPTPSNTHAASPDRDSCFRPLTGHLSVYLGLPSRFVNLAEVVEFCESVAAKLENAVNMALDEESSANADESNEVFLEVSGGVDDTTDHSEAVVRGLGIVESDDTEKDEAASVVGRVDSDCEGSVIVRIADADVYVEASKPDDGKMFEVDCDEDTEEDEDLEIKNAKRSSGKSENSADDDDDYLYIPLGPCSLLHGINQAVKSPIFETNQVPKSPISDSNTSFVTADEEWRSERSVCRSASQPSITKVLRESASAFFTRTKKGSEDSSKEISPTFAEFPNDSNVDFRVEMARRYTNTNVELLSPSDTDFPRRINDGRIWHSRNLRCTYCEGSCAICGAECCIYKAAKEVLAKPKNFQTRMCEHLVRLIDKLGSRAKDMSTFSVCILGGGCGRRVCPNCCGACPMTPCHDIQCKECKEDPWVVCDWHEQ